MGIWVALFIDGVLVFYYFGSSVPDQEGPIRTSKTDHSAGYLLVSLTSCTLECALPLAKDSVVVVVFSIITSASI